MQQLNMENNYKNEVLKMEAQMVAEKVHICRNVSMNTNKYLR